MSKALTLKLALAAAVLTVCAGYFVESYGVAQSTPAARSPAQTITVDGGPALGSNSMSVSSNGTTVTRHSNDGQHELTLTTVAGGDTTAQIKDADGKVLFNGPITTVADKAKVPADLLPLINGATRQGVLTIANPALFGMGRNTLTLDLIKQQLNPTDAEWTDMQDRIKTILTLQQYLATGNSAPSNTAQSVDAADAANPINGPVRDLSAALADSAAKPDDLESKLTALRAARIEVQDSLAKARHKLEDTLTPRQKAILVNLQILE